MPVSSFFGGVVVAVGAASVQKFGGLRSATSYAYAYADVVGKHTHTHTRTRARAGANAATT